MKFTAICAATSFDFCYNDYFIVQGRPGLWRKIHRIDFVPSWATILEASFEGIVFAFFLDEQAIEELAQFMQWGVATTPIEDRTPIEVLPGEEKIMFRIPRINIPAFSFVPPDDDLPF